MKRVLERGDARRKWVGLESPTSNDYAEEGDSIRGQEANF